MEICGLLSLVCARTAMLAALVRDPLPGWAALVVGWAQTRQRGRPTGQGDALTRQRAPLMAAL
nr:MAG TPA: hypothetical protein [Caudoviricetes sp.]